MFLSDIYDVSFYSLEVHVCNYNDDILSSIVDYSLSYYLNSLFDAPYCARFSLAMTDQQHVY